jgi:hypothetical protein
VSVTLLSFSEHKWKGVLQWNTHGLQMCTLQCWHTFSSMMFIYCMYKSVLAKLIALQISHSIVLENNISLYYVKYLLY